MDRQGESQLLYVQDEIHESELGGTRVELSSSRDLQQGGIWSYSCCGTITRMMGGGKLASKEA